MQYTAYRALVQARAIRLTQNCLRLLGDRNRNLMKIMFYPDGTHGTAPALGPSLHQQTTTQTAKPQTLQPKQTKANNKQQTRYAAATPGGAAFPTGPAGNGHQPPLGRYRPQHRREWNLNITFSFLAWFSTTNTNKHPEP